MVSSRPLRVRPSPTGDMFGHPLTATPSFRRYSDAMNTESQTIYVALLDEGVDVWRPVDAEVLPDGLFRIVSPAPDPDDERWEFSSGSIVRCEYRRLSEGRTLVAVERATV